MSFDLDRRRFVQNLATVGGALTLGATGLIATSCKTASNSGLLARGGVSETTAPVGAAARSLVRVRGSAADKNNKNVALYAQAIRKMKATPFPRQVLDENQRPIQTDWWEAHAIIHMNHCPHGNWFFLPWHRAYLVYFERVVREFSGDPSFALPYWNWSADGHIPAAFWDDPDLSHPLPNPNPRDYSRREVTRSEAADAGAVGQAVVERILDTNDFLTFASGRSRGTRTGGGGTGQLEGLPHNSTHGWIGGDMGQFLSPRDPIFWMHHCNIDRLWAVWQQRQASKGRSTLPPRPTTKFGSQAKLTPDYWLMQTMGTFYNFDKTASDGFMTVKETQNIADLGYSYETDKQAALVEIAASGQAVTQGESSEVIPLTRTIVPNDAAKTLLITIKRTPEVTAVLQAFQDNCEATKVQQATRSVLRLCVDNAIVPQNPRTASLAFYLMSSGIQSKPNYMGTHAFFVHTGSGHEHHTEGANVPTASMIFDLYEPLKALTAANRSLAKETSDIPVLVHVKSDNDFPSDKRIFDQISVRLEYDVYG